MTRRRGSYWPPSTPDPNSIAAANSIRSTVDTQRAHVLQVVRDHTPGGVAEWQIVEITGLAGNSVRPRLWELLKLGLVIRRGTNRTPHGRKAYLHHAVTVAPVPAEWSDPAPKPRPIFGRPETGRV